MPNKILVFAVIIVLIGALLAITVLPIGQSQNPSVNGETSAVCPNGEYNVQENGTGSYNCQGSYLSSQFNSTYGLVGYWPLDDQYGSIAKDVSGNGNDLSLVNNGNLVWLGQPNCKFNGCINQTGSNNDYLTLSNIKTYSLPQNNSFTSSIWINSLYLPFSFSGIYGIRNSTDGRLSWEIYVDASGYAHCERYDGINDIDVNSHIDVQDGNWHLVACERYLSPNKLGIIVDGVSRANLTDISINFQVAPLHIFDGEGSRYQGIVDDPRIYNYSLNAYQNLYLFIHYPVQYSIQNFQEIVTPFFTYHANVCTDTTSGTLKMMGFKDNYTTPNYPQTVAATIIFNVGTVNSAPIIASTYRLTYGTGNAPNCNDAATGIATGDFHVQGSIGRQLTGVDIYVATLAANTQYWFDLTVNDSSVAGWTYSDAELMISG